MSQVELYRYVCGEAQTAASQALMDWLNETETDRSYLPMMQHRVSGKAAEHCNDTYYIAMQDGQIISRLWHGWGRHPHAVGNFGNFLTKDEFRGMGVGRKLLDLWYEDLMTQKERPIGLFCSTLNGFRVEMYRRYGFTQAVILEKSSMLYKPLDDSPGTFAELCEDYYCDTKSLTVRPAAIEWRHEIDLLLKFALMAEGEKLGLPGCSFVEETVVWPHIGTAELVFTDKNRPVGWSFTGNDGITHWQIHPKYRKQFSEMNL